MFSAPIKISTNSVKEYFKKQKVSLTCPICHSQEVSIGEQTVLLTISQERDARKASGFTQPYVISTCSNCSYNMLFSALPMGIIK